MNNVVNREKRMLYVNRLLAFQGNGKKIIYMNETNVNLFLCRKLGRRQKGTRCSVKSPTSRGKNIHIIGAISQTGLLYGREGGAHTAKKTAENGSESACGLQWKLKTHKISVWFATTPLATSLLKMYFKKRSSQGQIF